MAAKLEPLSEREIALARGEDPDKKPEQVVEQIDPNPTTEQPQEAAEAQSGAEEHGSGKDAEVDLSWVDEDTRALATSFGITDDDLKGVGGAEEFRRLTGILERTAPVRRQVEVPAVVTPAQVSQEVPAEGGKKKREKLDRKKYEAAWEDENSLAIVDAHNTLIDEIEAMQGQFQSLQQFQAQQQVQRELDAFHDAVDAFNPERYGKTVDEKGRVGEISREHDDRRRQLFGAAMQVRQNIINQQTASGAKEVRLPPMSVVLKRADELAFGADNRAAERKRVHEEIRKQSQTRRPVGGRATKTPAAAASTATGGNRYDPIQEVVNHPELVALWEKFQEVNGK